MQRTMIAPAFRIPWRVALVLTCCGFGMTACKRQIQPPTAPLPEVMTVTVSQQPLTLTTELPGRTSPYRVADVRPQINGLIQKRLFTEGADVQAGQELYQIDPAPFQAALDTAQAALDRSMAVLPAIQLKTDRVRQALADKSVSQQDLDDATSALKQAEADIQYWKAMVATARINLGYTRIVAPVAGRIGRSTVTDGAIVTAYQPAPLTTIQQLDPIYVDVPQATSDLLALRRRLLEEKNLRDATNEANQVQLILGDNSPYAQAGTFQFRDVTVDATTESVILRMVFPNPDGVLLPGMYVRAVVKQGVNDQAILIPQQAVSRDPKGNPLLLLVDASDKVEQRQIVLDRAVGDQWLVASGLKPGERIIVEGVQKVRPGAPVRALPSGGATPAATLPAPAAK